MALTGEQIDTFRRDGVLVVENAITARELRGLRGDFQGWVDESRRRDHGWGEIMDGRPRFDIEVASHSAEHPALRRVNAPCEISDAYFHAMAESRMVDMVADLIGPDVKHHHNKINSKLPGAATAVKWHQDFLFTPHTNDDLVTALLMVDDVTAENGPLEVDPGSHAGPLHSLWHGDAFTGAIAEPEAERMKSRAVTCCGPAGAVCLMHTRLAHGSAPNRSEHPRTLFISVYSAADALPCSRNPVPNRHEGVIVRGSDPGTVRSTPFELRLPEYPKSASFFTQQANG